MASKTRILVVEDDREIASLVARYLGANEYHVTIAGDGRAMDAKLADGSYDLIVLDLMLPGEDGLEICRRLSVDPRIPIVILTARGSEFDRIVGLELGAADYLAKPFEPRELLARIRAVLRRTGLGATQEERPAPRSLVFDGYELDTLARRLTGEGGVEIALTGAEFDLLQVLIEHRDRVMSRDRLLDLTRGRTGGPFDRSVDILISRIRHKIEADPRHPTMIRTMRTGGYIFVPEVHGR